MPSPAAWSSPSLEVPSPAPLSVDDSPASRSRGSSRSRSRVSPRNSNADTQLPPKTAPATLDTNTNAADHNHLSPTSATAKTATVTATAAAAPPSPSSQPTTPLGSGSWLSRMFKKGKKEDTVSPPATAPAAVDDGYRSIFASGQEYRAEQDVIALNQNILNTSTIHNHEINIDYESMVSGAVVRGHTYGMEELERQHQTQSSIHFEQPIERKLDDDTRLLIYAPATNTPRIYQYPQKVEKFVPVNLSDRGTPSPSLSPWLATDVSQATTFQPPSVTRTRGASRDVKNRKILKAVLPTPPLTSQPTVKRALPDVMPLSTVPSTNTSASTSPRKSVGFASTTANTKRTSVVNHRRRASSIDGGMDDHYDEVFDDVLADDLDDYEDVDVSEDHGMEDISDDDDKENQYDENFALAEARAFQVIQQQKIKQERELQQHRQKEYQEATKMWL